MFNNKLLIKKIITIFISVIILSYINLSFAQELISSEEKILPNIILFDENKNVIDLNSYIKKNNHKVIILNFWATWCPPCIDELPSLNKLAKKLNQNKIKIIAVSMDRGNEKKLIRFLKEKGGDDLMFLQDKKWSAGKLLNIKGLPETFIIIKKVNDYKIIFRHLGPLEWNSEGIKNKIIQLIEKNKT